MRHWFWQLALLPVVLVPQPARADTTAMMADFGLLGIWSENCSGAEDLIRFNRSSAGGQINIGQPGIVQFSSTIESAVRDADEQISLGFGGGLAAPKRFVTLRLHDGTLRVWQSWADNKPPDVADGHDVASGASTPVLFHCVSE